MSVASHSRTDDLSYVGIPSGPHTAHGADYWDQFTFITRTAIRNVRRHA